MLCILAYLLCNVGMKRGLFFARRRSFLCVLCLVFSPQRPPRLKKPCLHTLGKKRKERPFEAAQTYSSKSTICEDIFVHVKSKFKPVKDNREYCTSRLFWDLSGFYMNTWWNGCYTRWWLSYAYNIVCLNMPNNTQMCILKVWVVKILEMDTLAFEVV